MNEQIVFDVQVYGEGGGVMFSFTEESTSAEECARAVAVRFVNTPQAARVGVWAQDRRSGHAQAVIGAGAS